VSYVERRCLERSLEPRDPCSHLNAQLSVKVRQWLVEQCTRDPYHAEIDAELLDSRDATELRVRLLGR
jgi:hypothetical protein